MHLWRVRIKMRAPLMDGDAVTDASGSEPALPFLCESLSLGWRSAGDEQGVVATDGANHRFRRSGIERDTDEVGGAGRGLEDDEAGGGLGGADPFGEQVAQSCLAGGHHVPLIWQGVAGLPAAADLDRAKLVQIPADGGLGDVVPRFAQGGDEFVLAGQAQSSEQVGKSGEAPVAAISHMKVYA